MNDQSQPKVSVLVAIYRTPPFMLREAIRSVLGQTFANFELILLDDCPSDPRESIVREFADPRIVYTKNARNLGISQTRNRLIEMARGVYLAVLDHDDVCRCDRLEKEAAWLDAHPECGAVSSYTRHVPCGRIIERPIEDHAIRVRLVAGNALSHSALMLRASVLREHGLRYESRYSPAEDYRLMFRLMDLTTFHCIPEPLLDYREHDANTTGRQYGKMMRAARRIQDDARMRHPDLVREYLSAPGSSPRYRCPVSPGFRVFEAFRMGWMGLTGRK